MSLVRQKRARPPDYAAPSVREVTHYNGGWTVCALKDDRGVCGSNADARLRKIASAVFSAISFLRENTDCYTLPRARQWEERQMIALARSYAHPTAVRSPPATPCRFPLGNHWKGWEAYSSLDLDGFNLVEDKPRK